METEIEKAIKVLANRITSDVKSDDAQRFSQAALNLAHVQSVLVETRINSKRGG
jgi:hypothetical protein